MFDQSQCRRLLRRSSLEVTSQIPIAITPRDCSPVRPALSVRRLGWAAAPRGPVTSWNVRVSLAWTSWLQQHGTVLPALAWHPMVLLG